MFYVESNDKVKIAVYDQNKSASKTIVLVHGWPLNSDMFEYQIPTLINAGYRVVRMDIRGFGKSDAPAHGYTYDQFATDLYHVIKALDLRNFALLGFSMGGAVVTRYMGMYQGYGVNKLILLDAAVPSYCKNATNPYGASVDDTNKLINLGLKDRPSLNKYFGSIFFQKQHPQIFLDWFQRLSDSASGIGEMQSLILLRDGDVFNDLNTINVPTAIFHGKQDQICSFKMAEIMHQNIRNSILVPFDQAGHGAFYDDLDQVNQQLINFLDRNQINNQTRNYGSYNYFTL